jgi:hypothetical protein
MDACRGEERQAVNVRRRKVGGAPLGDVIYWHTNDRLRGPAFRSDLDPCTHIPSKTRSSATEKAIEKGVAALAEPPRPHGLPFLTEGEATRS